MIFQMIRMVFQKHSDVSDKPFGWIRKIIWMILPDEPEQKKKGYVKDFQKTFENDFNNS